MDDDTAPTETSSPETQPVPSEQQSVPDAAPLIPPQIDPIPDTRLYVPDHSDWEAHIKRNSDRFYCYSKHPGQDWFHLLLDGEIYIGRQDEKYRPYAAHCDWGS